MKIKEEKMEKTIIKGFIFIVPNEIFNEKVAINHEQWEKEKATLDMKLKAWEQKPGTTDYIQVWIGSEELGSWVDCPELDKVYGINLPKGTRIAHKWVYDEKIDKWIETKDYCHKSLNHYLSYFPSRLPLEMVKNLKEGDTLEMEYRNYIFQLKADQLNYRYRRFGRFEEVIKSLL